MVVRTKRRMITRAKTKGEMALMKSRMQRLQKERVNVTFEEAEVLQGGPGRTAHRRAPARAPKKEKKITITEQRHKGSSVILDLQGQRTSPTLVTVYAHLPSDWYRIRDLPIVLFNRWTAGDAVPKTTDIRYFKRGPRKGQRKTPRWKKGVGPSLGAFMNQYILKHYKMERIPGAPNLGADDIFADYYDDDNDVYGAPITNG